MLLRGTPLLLLYGFFPQLRAGHGYTVDSRKSLLRHTTDVSTAFAIQGHLAFTKLDLVSSYVSLYLLQEGLQAPSVSARFNAVLEELYWRSS